MSAGAHPAGGQAAWPAPGARLADVTRMDRVLRSRMQGDADKCITIVLRLDAALDVERVRQAACHLVRMVPILCARPRDGRGEGYWEFVPPSGADALATCRTVAADDEQRDLVRLAVARPPDLSAPPGVRIAVLDGPTAHAVVFQVHHALMDGTGVFRALAAFSACYRELGNDPRWEPAGALCMDRSWRQMIRQVPLWRFLQAPLDRPRRAWRQVRLAAVRRRCASFPIGDRPGPFPDGGAPAPGWESIEIDALSVAAVRRNAPAAGATISDLVLAAHASALCRWNRARGQDCRWVRTGYALDLRRWWGQPEGTFANMFSADNMLARNPADPAAALRDLKPRLDRARRTMGAKELWLATLASLLPRACAQGFGRLLQRSALSLSGGSVLFSNVGAVPPEAGDFGDARALGCTCLGSAPPPPNLLLMLSGFRGTLRLDLRYDGRHLERDTACAYLRSVKDAFLELGRGAGASGPGTDA